MKRIILILLAMAGLASGAEGINSFYPAGDYYYTLDSDNVVAALNFSDGTEHAKAHASLAANVTATNFTASDVTDSAGSEFSRSDGKTLKLECLLEAAGTMSVNIPFASSQDCSNSYIAFAYYIENNTNINYIQFNLRNSASAANYFYILNLPTTTGYHYVEFDLEGGILKALTPNAAAMNQVRFQVAVGGDATSAVLYLDYIRVIRNHTKPRVMISFDNGYDNHYSTVYPALQARGIKGNFGIITDRVGDEGYATEAQIQTMINAGHLICNHSYDHTLWQDAAGDASWVNLMYYQRVEQLLRSREYFKGKDWGDAQFFYIHPSGSGWLNYANAGSYMTAENMNQAVRFLMQNYSVVRLTAIPGNGTVQEGIDGTIAAHQSSNLQYSFPNPGSCNRLLYAIGGAGHDLQWHKDVIDKAVLGNGLVSFYWHHIKDDGDMTAADFTALLDYAIAQGCEFITMKDVCPIGQPQSGGKSIFNISGLKSGGKQ